MNTFESSSTITFVGDSAAGEAAAALLGSDIGSRGVNVNVVLGSAGSSSDTDVLRKNYRLSSADGFDDTIAALSANSYAAPYFMEAFTDMSSVQDVAASGEKLLTALSYSDTPLSDERQQHIVARAVDMAGEVAGHDSLEGLSLGRLIVSSRMKEHRLAGLSQGKNAQTAIDETAALMDTRGRVIIDSLVPHDATTYTGEKRLYGKAAMAYHTEHEDTSVLEVMPVGDFSDVPANPSALDAIASSDEIITVPETASTPLCIKGIAEAIAASRREKNAVLELVA